MGMTTMEPRDAGTKDMAEIDEVFFALTEQAERHAEQACITTCRSGWTIVCDGSTFKR